jgi:hypothetical protein
MLHFHIIDPSFQLCQIRLSVSEICQVRLLSISRSFFELYFSNVQLLCNCKTKKRLSTENHGMKWLINYSHISCTQLNYMEFIILLIAHRSVHMRLYSMHKREFVMVFLAFFACFGLGVFIGLAGK